MDTKQGMYTVCDTKAEASLPPFCARTDYEAQRMFSDSVARPGTPLHDHPEDFLLIRIGSFDMSTGVLVVEQHKSLGSGSDFVRHDTQE